MKQKQIEILAAIFRAVCFLTIVLFARLYRRIVTMKIKAESGRNLNMNTRKLTMTAMLAACALVVFILEAQLPPIVPIPGIKPGLANVMTLIAFAVLGKREALGVLLTRIVLGSIFTGNLMSMAFSVIGGVFAYGGMLLIMRIIKNPVAVSIVGAIAHNIGQIFTAMLFTKTPQLLYYCPLLMMSAILTGLFTGVIAAGVIRIVRKHMHQ